MCRSNLSVRVQSSLGERWALRKLVKCLAFCVGINTDGNLRDCQQKIVIFRVTRLIFFFQITPASSAKPSSM